MIEKKYATSQSPEVVVLLIMINVWICLIYYSDWKFVEYITVIEKSMQPVSRQK